MLISRIGTPRRSDLQRFKIAKHGGCLTRKTFALPVRSFMYSYAGCFSPVAHFILLRQERWSSLMLYLMNVTWMLRTEHTTENTIGSGAEAVAALTKVSNIYCARTFSRTTRTATH